MANKILVEENWQERVGNKMGVDSAYLPDSAINQPDIIGVAELNTTSMFPSYEDFEGDNLVYLESIAILECCILLCPSMSARLPKKESGPHAGHELYVNWDNKKAEFIGERNSLVDRLEDLINPSRIDSFNSFIATFPKRGW